MNEPARGATRMNDPVQTRIPREDFIALHRVSKSYGDSGAVRDVLKSLDFTIAEGAFVALLGRSGAGKSTLLNLLGGLDVPTSGEIHIAGTRLDVLDDDARTLYRRRHIGFVFQSYNLVPTLNVLDNVMLPMELAGTKKGDDSGPRSQARALLAEVGLGDRHAEWPDRLSGGEQQRVAIARALAHQPMLLLADEPTGNLDYSTGRTVMDLLHRLVRETRTTMLVVTHDRDFLQASDRIVRMHDGRMVDISYDEAVAS
ncbi:MAG: ABC transporter ATP-binding protein [Rhodothermales bacterium]